MTVKHPTLMVFLASTLAVFGALAWVTRHALSLERQQRQARIEAQVQERVRLALWRMESKANALIARESARPYFEYQPFYPAGRAYTRMLEEVRAGEVLVPSPLLTLRDRYVKLFFQIDALGIVTSPQAPTGNLRDLAEATYLSSTDVIGAGDRLEVVSRWMTRSQEIVGPAPMDSSAPVAPSTTVDVMKDGLSAKKQAAPPDSTPESGRGPGTPPPSQVKGEANAQLSSRNAAEEQSLAEYRARISSTESAKETPQVDNRAPTKQASRSATGQTAGVNARQQADPAVVAEASKPQSDQARTNEPPPGAPTGRAQAPPARAAAPPATPVSEPDRKDKDAASSDFSRSGGSARPESPGRPGGVRQSPSEQKGVVPQSASPPVSTLPAPPALEADAYDANLDTVHEKLQAMMKDQQPLDLGVGLNRFYSGVPNDESAVEIGSFTAQWAGGHGARGTTQPELLFVREIELGESKVRQGFWVDWEVLRKDLLDGVRDLLPEATLTPVTSMHTDTGNVDVLGRRLASFPAELEPGPDCAASLGAGLYGWSPLRNTLILAWAGVLIAIAAIAFLLRAATDLAERRGRFVSAVTHELRTPLTTFVMYSQMLADGMVPEGDAKQHYYGTLKREASRLAGIVENVLEFARVSRSKRARKAPSNGSSVPASALMERLSLPLKQRTEQAQQLLDVSIDEAAKGQLVTTDELTIERILFNLVDNACKYGKGPGGVVRVHVSVDGPSIVFTVSDDGPGIGADDRPRIFKAFERGGKQADGSIPGLGLGLALSRGLAKDLGGDLTLVSAVPATFVLRVPR